MHFWKNAVLFGGPEKVPFDIENYPFRRELDDLQLKSSANPSFGASVNCLGSSQN